MVVKRGLRATTHDQLETTIVHLVEIGYYRQWCVNHQGKGKPLSKKKSRENLMKAQQEAAMAARVDESEADRLAREEHIIATFASQKEQHAHAKDISVRRGVFDARRLRERTRWVVSFRILGAFRARRARSEL